MYVELLAKNIYYSLNIIGIAMVTFIIWCFLMDLSSHIKCIFSKYYKIKYKISSHEIEDLGKEITQYNIQYKKYILSERFFKWKNISSCYFYSFDAAEQFIKNNLKG